MEKIDEFQNKMDTCQNKKMQSGCFYITTIAQMTHQQVNQWILKTRKRVVVRGARQQCTVFFFTNVTINGNRICDQRYNDKFSAPLPIFWLGLYVCICLCACLYIYKWVSKIRAMKSVICRVKSLHKTGWNYMRSFMQL